MIIETQDGKELSTEKIYTVVTFREKNGQDAGWAIIGVAREQFETLGVFADLERAKAVHAEMKAANRAGKELYKVPEA